MGLCDEGFESVGARHSFHVEVAKRLSGVVVALAADAKAEKDRRTAEKERAKAPRKRSKQCAGSQLVGPPPRAEAVCVRADPSALDPWAC